jgi:hypothetical protein
VYNLFGIEINSAFSKIFITFQRILVAYMKKDELIHLHSLLAVVYEYCEGKQGQDIDTAHYTSLNVSPTAVYQPKEEQRKAVLSLLNAITASINEEEEKTPLQQSATRE